MVDVVTQPTRVATGGYIDWGAILGGAAIAAALSFVLLTFGAAIGLSMVSPYPSQSYGRFAASVAAFWALAVPILSLLAGGYVAGRMRGAWENARDEEVEFRDGVHGLLVWAVSVIIGGVLALMTAAGAAQVGADVGKVAMASDRSQIIAPGVDFLLRGTSAAAGSGTSETGTATPPSSARASPNPNLTSTEARADVLRTMGSAVASGKLTAADKQYVAQIVSQRTGLAPAEAERRVDQAFAEAVSAADKARKTAVVAGLVAGVALLLALAAAWYAAQRGGQHREQNVPIRLGLPQWPAGRRPPAREPRV